VETAVAFFVWQGCEMRDHQQVCHASSGGHAMVYGRNCLKCAFGALISDGAKIEPYRRNGARLIGLVGFFDNAT
jgi:hypothetical protein